jgi:hypothetical protein
VLAKDRETIDLQSNKAIIALHSTGTLCLGEEFIHVGGASHDGLEDAFSYWIDASQVSESSDVVLEFNA